jgi:hypothetical protein
MDPLSVFMVLVLTLPIVILLMLSPSWCKDDCYCPLEDWDDDDLPEDIPLYTKPR